MNSKRFTFLTLFLIILIGFITFCAQSFPLEDDASFSALFTEGTIAAMSVFVLVALQWFNGRKRVYYLLTIGLSFLSLSYVSDTMDDFFEISEEVGVITEEYFQLFGYLIFFNGLFFWLIQNQRQITNLNIIAHTDQLTGAYNRHKLESLFLYETGQANQNSRPISLVIFDLDFFKSINDSEGHGMGDTVLTETANVVKKQIRESDHFARIGGEEFVILYPSAQLHGAHKSAEKIRESIANHNFPCNRSVSASFGVTQYVAGESLEELIHRADQALYQAKESGRNRVIVANPQEE